MIDGIIVSNGIDNEINFVQFRLRPLVITTNANKKLYIKIKLHLKNVSLKFFQSFVLNFLIHRRNRLLESASRKNLKISYDGITRNIQCTLNAFIYEGIHLFFCRSGFSLCYCIDYLLCNFVELLYVLEILWLLMASPLAIG